MTPTLPSRGCLKGYAFWSPFFYSLGLECRRRCVAPAVIAALVPLSIPSIAGEELRNWFDDPFFQITAAIASCPEPTGPRVTEADRQLQSHRRAEKGTTCWLAKECERPNAYAYDREIATEIQAAVSDKSPFPNTALWVTVQGRVVYIEGCVENESQATAVEAFVRALPNVQQAIAIVTANLSGKPPYKLFVAR